MCALGTLNCNKYTQPKTSKIMKNRKRAPFGPHKISGVFLGILLIGSHSAMAATDTMTANDPGGQTSFNTGTRWLSGIAPAPGTDYSTSTFEMRGIASGTFLGNSLTIPTTGALHGKINGTLTFSNGTGLFLNGGTIYQANSFNSGNIFTIAGTITANASTTSFLNSAFGESLDITGAIGGSGNLSIAGGGPITGVSFVKFSAANTLSGTVSVVSPGSMSDATNRFLQLNNVNALQNATLALTGGNSLVNLVSFTSASNTGAYNIGALSGAANQALTDTASTAVAISVGANNVSTTYSGILSGAGSLTKDGTGTLTLSGANTYTGGTTVSAGKLIVNGNISTTLVNGTGTLGGSSGTVGALTVASGGTVAPGASGNSAGILSAGNTVLQAGSTLGMDINGSALGTGYDQLNITGTVSLANALSLNLGGYTPVNNALFFILANDGTDAVTGTFSNAPIDGSTYTLGGQQFQISYFGDSTGGTFTGGNDVVLMAVPEPGAALLGGFGMLALLRRRRK